MKLITLLPADKYVVVNKTVLTEQDRKNLINLYEPIIGFAATSLYLTLWSDLDRLEIMSKDFNHHHLMSLLKCDLDSIKSARDAIEAVGLIKTYFKEGDVNSYVYELYSPLSAAEFFNNPILNIVLYNNIGEIEYNDLKKSYKKVSIDLRDYEDITKTLNETFEATNAPVIEARAREVLPLNIKSELDFDVIISSMPKGIIKEKAFNKKMRELLINLAFIYDLDTLKITELIRASINENGSIDKESLRKSKVVSGLRRIITFEFDCFLYLLIFIFLSIFIKTKKLFLITFIIYYILIPCITKGYTLGSKFLNVRLEYLKNRLINSTFRIVFLFCYYFLTPYTIFKITFLSTRHISTSLTIYVYLLILIGVLIFYFINVIVLLKNKTMFYDKYFKVLYISTLEAQEKEEEKI